MGKLPAILFYPADWLKEPSLRRCGHGHKGVWIDMLCLLHECEERGVFVSGGKPWTIPEIAIAIGGEPSVTIATINDLLAFGVARRRPADGAIFNKRMVNDESKRQKCKEAGYRGGNPALKGTVKGQALTVKGMDKGQPSTLNRALEDEDGTVSGTETDEKKDNGAAEVLPPQSEWVSPSDARKPGWKRFHEAYPASERSLTAWRLWNQMGLEEIVNEVMLGLELWKKSERWREGHVMGMRRFMEDRKWNDAPPPPKAKPHKPNDGPSIHFGGTAALAALPTPEAVKIATATPEALRTACAAIATRWEASSSHGLRQLSKYLGNHERIMGDPAWRTELVKELGL